MFGSSNTKADKKDDLVKNAKQERELRQEKKRKLAAVIKIQSWIRMVLRRRQFQQTIRTNFDESFSNDAEINTALSIFSQTNRLFSIYDGKMDEERFFVLCKSILTSLECGKEPQYWFMSVMLMKDWTSLWIKRIKQILNLCGAKLKTCQIYIGTANKSMTVYLTMLVLFTDCTNWKILKMPGGENIRPVMQHLCCGIISDLVSKGLFVSLRTMLINAMCKKKVVLSQAILYATTTILSRGLRSLDASARDLVFITKILTIPAYVHHLEVLCKESFVILQENKFYKTTLTFLHDYANMAKVYQTLDADNTVALIGNLITLCKHEIEQSPSSKASFKVVVVGLLNHCSTFLGKHSCNSKFHPIIGWCNETAPSRTTNDTAVHVLAQLGCLWNKPLVGIFFQDLPSLDDSDYALSSHESEAKGSVLRRAFMKTFKRTSAENINVNEPVVADVCSSCDLYRALAHTLTQCKLEIVTGLGFQEDILIQLWRFIYSLGIPSVLKSILNYFTGESEVLGRPLSSLLILFCDCLSQLIPILDDSEIYEKQKPFTCEDLVKMSSFLNALVFKLLWNRFTGTTPDKEDEKLRKACLDLLLMLYSRDCRRAFAPPNHWLIKELRINQFLSEFKAKDSRARSLLDTIPHVIPLMERVKIFYEWVGEDKRSMGIDKEFSRPSAVVSVHRNRILEDGYEQLSCYHGSDLKGIIRVEFINKQGLAEAGIDQHGVFKEFLEDVIREAFNPQLNLFRMTTDTQEQKLYPSPTSFIHQNHLNLFEFVGKMLGKAVYEGILVDIPFAPFFLNTILQHNKCKINKMYSSIDELPSLDPEMYRNLHFVKNYDGDIADLQLVFAYDEDVLGQMVTHDLKPGGRAISVTNENKFMYIHLMAQFRIHTQLRNITSAFIAGFCSIIAPHWLNIFSTGEFQHLISGDAAKMDLSDLRNHTRYFGGYHSNHPTILWLWDILQNDFTLAEKKLFLKFVTSCSNPPLLGFKHLEPQFSIRFVDSAEGEDDTDTVGSVVRGLFNVRKGASGCGARLPTSSTCFNLLKLPSYKKKSVLKEKLRYAINSGAGFELS